MQVTRFLSKCIDEFLKENITNNLESDFITAVITFGLKHLLKNFPGGHGKKYSEEREETAQNDQSIGL